VNPYQHVAALLGNLGGGIVASALSAVLQLLGEAYPGDFDPSDRESHYVMRQVSAKFGHDHPITRKLRELFAESNL